jgi:predicted enzyme related to lactoylglutathione lyase
MRKVVHFEIPHDDLDKAKKFYSGVFGWKLIDYPELKYTIVQTAKTDKEGMIMELGAINGGLTKRSDKVQTPVITIDVEDIDQTFKDVKEFGGEVISDKMKVGDMGISAYVKDCEGNVIGLWQNANPPKPNPHQQSTEPKEKKATKRDKTRK